MGGLFRIMCGLLCFVILVNATMAAAVTGDNQIKSQHQNSGTSLNAFQKFYKHCETAEDLVRCMKQQALKLVNRALNLKSINLLDGLSLMRRDGYAQSKLMNEIPTEQQMRSLSSNEIDTSLWNSAGQFIQSYRLQLNLPKMFEQARMMVVDEAEGRGKKKKKQYLGPFLAAMAIKAGILKMAYHSIAIVAGKALSKYSPL